jgi:hypothetical protein
MLGVILAAIAVAGVSSFEVKAAPQRSKVVSRQAPAKKNDKKGRSEKAAKKHGPMDVFADIEHGWRENDVDLILKHFGKSKVSISIEAGPSGGQFSKSQSYYLLKDLFKYTITKKFEFVQFRKPSEDGKSSFAVAERLYRKTDDGRLFKDKIYVSLHTEDGETWVVNEIKSIR